MFILVVELNLAKCRLPKGPTFVFNLRWVNQDPGDPGVGKVRGWSIFFPSSRVGGTDPG